MSRNHRVRKKNTSVLTAGQNSLASRAAEVVKSKTIEPFYFRKMHSTSWVEDDGEGRIFLAFAKDKGFVLIENVRDVVSLGTETRAITSEHGTFLIDQEAEFQIVPSTERVEMHEFLCDVFRKYVRMAFLLRAGPNLAIVFGLLDRLPTSPNQDALIMTAGTLICGKDVTIGHLDEENREEILAYFLKEPSERAANRSSCPIRAAT